MTSTVVTDGEYIFRSRIPSVPIPDVTLPEFVLQDAELYSENIAIIEANTGKRYTYGEVIRDTKRFAKALRSLGLRKGRVVLVLLPNMAESATVALGIMAAGGVYSGANPLSHPSEIRKQVEDSDAKLIVTNRTGYDKVKDLKIPTITISDENVEGTISWSDLLIAGERAGSYTIVEEEPLNQNDLCALPFSSGTTGKSKGVMLTHRNLVANLCSTLFNVGPELIGKFATLGLMPFFHIYGMTGICCATMRNKGKVVVVGRFEMRSFMNILIKEEVNFAPLVPPILLAIVRNPVVDEFDLSELKLRAVMTAAAPLPPDVRSAFEAKFPGVTVQEAYGLTEHSCITISGGGDPSNNSKKQSVGFILPNLEIKFVDPVTGISLPVNTPGEICVRSQCVMKGYFKNEEETQKTIDCEGWLHTGDVGYIDEDGYVFLVDRIKELIKYKGFQVAPADLEAVLHSHPSVLDAAVFSLPDEEAGEVPAACVVLSPDAKVNEDDIIDFVASNVATYKRIRAVQFVEAIPKSATGKILRRELREKMMDAMKTPP